MTRPTQEQRARHAQLLTEMQEAEARIREAADRAYEARVHCAGEICSYNAILYRARKLRDEITLDSTAAGPWNEIDLRDETVGEISFEDVGLASDPWAELVSQLQETA